MKRFYKRFIPLCLLTVSWLIALGQPGATSQAAPQAGVVHFVIPSGGAVSGTCSTWATACDLQYALSSAAPNDELWVKAGTYKPTTGTDRAATFHLHTGVAVYGGFAGTETARDQRNWSVSVTTLSGDIGTVGSMSDNVYHVIDGSYTDDTAVLDGVTIKDGYAFGATSCPGQQCGGGLYAYTGSPTIRHVTFEHNFASSFGGGAYFYNSAASLSEVTFMDNAAVQGGGVYDDNDAQLKISNSTFVSNIASGDGGGLYSYMGTPIIMTTTFQINIATHGGGMLSSNSDTVLSNASFKNNTATDGGGGLHNVWSDVQLMDVIFFSNLVTLADGAGGGMFNEYSSSTLQSVSFDSNTVSAGYGGGVYLDINSVMTATNVTFSNNQAQMDSSDNGGMGGALFLYHSATPSSLTNVTFANNKAHGYDVDHPGYGGAIYVNNGNITTTNSILWANTPDEIYNYGSTGTPIKTSIVQGGCPIGSTCSGLITSDPRLAVMSDYGGHVDTVALLPSSSAIDSANGSQCPAQDARGVARPLGSQCDIGAFESSGFSLSLKGGDHQNALINTAFAQPLQITVTAINELEPVDGGYVTFTPPSSGASASLVTSPAMITSSVASVNATANGLRGTYIVTATAAGYDDATLFHLHNFSPTVFYVKPAVTGAGSCASWANACTLQTALVQVTYSDEIWTATGTYTPTASTDRNATFSLPNGVGLYGGFAGTESTRSQRNWTLNVTTLSGDIGTIGNSSDNVYHVVTANATDSATVLDGFSVIDGNATGQAGGGVFINTGSLTIANCRIAHNFGDYGGGVFQGGSANRLDVINSRFELNSTSNHGGGLYIGGNATFTNTQIISNTASGHGGGLHAEAGTVIFNGGRVANNYAVQNGGGLNVNNQVILSGTQFISNTTAQNGGALLQWNAGYTSLLTNTFFVSNTANNGGALWMRSDAEVAATTFASNHANNWGGGLHLQGGYAEFQACTFSHNRSENYGGAISISGGGVALRGSRLLSNSSNLQGGALYASLSESTLENSVVIDNQAPQGSGVYLSGGAAQIGQTTLSHNTGDGSGILLTNSGSTAGGMGLTNVILANQTVGITVTTGNTATLNGVLWYGNGSNTGGGGSITIQNAITCDPAFAADGYHLTAHSAAIDHGVNSGITTDIDGQSRPMGHGYDLGADEFRYDVFLPLILK